MASSAWDRGPRGVIAAGVLVSRFVRARGEPRRGPRPLPAVEPEIRGDVRIIRVRVLVCIVGRPKWPPGLSLEDVPPGAARLEPLGHCGKEESKKEGLEHAGGVGMPQRVGSHRLADARLGHGQLAGLLQGGRSERHVLGPAREKIFRPLAENRCLLAVVWL